MYFFYGVISCKVWFPLQCNMKKMGQSVAMTCPAPVQQMLARSFHSLGPPFYFWNFDEFRTYKLSRYSLYSCTTCIYCLLFGESTSTCCLNVQGIRFLRFPAVMPLSSCRIQIWWHRCTQMMTMENAAFAHEYHESSSSFGVACRRTAPILHTPWY